jgi:hypothetical protein
MSKRPFRIAAVVFDFDGTLTRLGAIDFVAIHKAVGCPKGMGLLEFLAAIGDPQKRSGTRCCGWSASSVGSGPKQSGTTK